MTYLSLPKNGSSLPSLLVTHSHGAPNAPLSTASWVDRVSMSLTSCSLAAARMVSHSPGEKRPVSARTRASTPAWVRFRLGGVQKLWKKLSRTAWKVSRG